jgi:CubicO group peptidase (beta-lactamase class C family)
VPQTPVGYTPDWLPEWDRMCSGIADLKPMFVPGSRTAYHSLNFGYIIGEVLRRVDGRTLSRFFADEICAPLKLADAHFGVPDSELHRVAVLIDAPAAPLEFQARMVGEPAGCNVAAVFNRREVLQACIPGSGGVFSARGLARHYAMIGDILPASRIREATELQSFERDEIYGVRTRRALGYRLGADTGPLASPAAFGHVGGGGSFGYADPARRLAIGFAKNYFLYRTPIVTPDEPARTVAQQVTEAVVAALGLPAQTHGMA